ncbi:hypothetical protein OHA98_41210 [Streptomyces sp. NBC_00654]|nr:hypothetical protein [Streptomyces sp. NBC_00654]MCX4971035.1 hypothetical protein [Streptomyces sp. NBC_00654]
MSDDEIPEPKLTRPQWFGDRSAWWIPALRSKDFAARVEPLGIDG